MLLDNFQYCIKLKGKIFFLNYFYKVFIVDQTVNHV